MASDGSVCTGVGRHRPPPPTVRNYATWTGTRRNLEALNRHGMRVLTGPDQLSRRGIPPLAWALDNGAWSCHTDGRDFDGTAFREAVRRWGYAADWIAVPDIVGGGLESLALSMRWLDELTKVGRPLLIPVQDGMEPDHLLGLLGSRVGIFVGGTTRWKEQSLPVWGRVAAQAGCWLHVGRVNTARRVQLAIDAGAHSIDGTTITMYADTAPAIDRATRGEPRLSLFP